MRNVRFEDKEGFDLSASLSSTSTSPCAPSSSVAKSLPSPTSTAPCAPSSSILISTTVSSTSVDADDQYDMKLDETILQYGRLTSRIKEVSRSLQQNNRMADADDDEEGLDLSEPSGMVSATALCRGAEGKNKKKRIKHIIRDIYSEHNPEKLENVDGLMHKYHGREMELLDAICRTYL